MKKIVLIALLLILPVSCFAGVTLISFDGKVQVYLADTDNWVEAQEELPLKDSDKIKTSADSGAEILCDDETYFKLGENTQFTVGQKENKWDLFYGWVMAKVNSKKASKFKIKTPVAVCSVRGTELAVEHMEDTQVGVFEGEVAVNSLDKNGKLSKKSVKLMKNKQLNVRHGKKLGKAVALKQKMVAKRKHMEKIRKRIGALRKNWKNIPEKKRAKIRKKAKSIMKKKDKPALKKKIKQNKKAGNATKRNILRPGGGRGRR